MPRSDDMNPQNNEICKIGTGIMRSGLESLSERLDGP